jgi:ubiquinone/menaquinone biosynthesis C-methylase UbiE
MEEVQAYYNEKARNYDASFDSLGFRLLDTITWKHLEPYVPTSPDTFVLDAGGGTGRWATLLAKKVAMSY